MFTNIIFPAQVTEGACFSVRKLQITNNTRALKKTVPYIPHFLLRPAQDQKAYVYLTDRNAGKMGAKLTVYLGRQALWHRCPGSLGPTS